MVYDRTNDVGKKVIRVIANWKMHGCLSANDKLLSTVLSNIEQMTDKVKICVCVPFPYLAQVKARLNGSRIEWGSQDVSAQEQGPFTGEVAATMIAEFGARYTIVGHSERRIYHGECDRTIAQKTVRALSAGVTPIICIGETLDQRKVGNIEQVIGMQIDSVLDLLTREQSMRIIVAYEPVWAIGTGNSMTSTQAQKILSFLRRGLIKKGAECVPLLYGGSVNPSNAAELFAQPDIDGGLIGSAALKAEDFIMICQAAC
ncbi:MAG: triose-phosphate isomerase [Burkholderia sp.]|nr:triose-phosphate isomerase [Burkholderia sp.]